MLNCWRSSRRLAESARCLASSSALTVLSTRILPPLVSSRVPTNGHNAIRWAGSISGSKDQDRGRLKILTVPNVLSICRIAMTPVIGYLVVDGAFAPAMILFAVASATDLLDGWIARNVPGQKSLLGSVLDPVADKLLVGVLFVTTTYAGLVPIALTAVVLIRDVSLIAGGFIKRHQTMERPITLSRFFDPKVSSMQIVPSFISKLNTVLQVSVVTLALVMPVLHTGEHVDLAFNALCLATGLTTVWSGLQYASGRAIKKV